MSRDGWVRMPHDLIVGPGQMDESGDVGRGWAAGLCNFPPCVAGKWLWVQYGVYEDRKAY